MYLSFVLFIYYPVGNTLSQTLSHTKCIESGVNCKIPHLIYKPPTTHLNQGLNALKYSWTASILGRYFFFQPKHTSFICKLGSSDHTLFTKLLPQLTSSHYRPQKVGFCTFSIDHGKSNSSNAEERHAHMHKAGSTYCHYGCDSVLVNSNYFI